MNRIIGCATLAITILTASYSEALVVGGVKGQFRNFTQFDNSSFEIHADLVCSKPIGSGRFHTERSNAVAKISANGEYTIPELSVDSREFPTEYNCELIISFQLTDEIRKNYSGIAFQRILKNNREINDLTEVQAVTAIEIQSNKVDYKINTEISSTDFVNGPGKNFSFTLSIGAPSIAGRDPKKLDGVSWTRPGYYYQNSVAQTPGGVLFLSGLHEPSEVNVEARAEVYEIMSSSKNAKKVAVWNLAKPLPIELRQFELDISTLMPTSINGFWNNSSLDLLRSTDTNGYKKFFSYDMSATMYCISGILMGEIEISLQTFGEIDPHEVLAKDQKAIIKGTCESSENAKGRFTLDMTDGKPREFYFTVNRSAAAVTPILLSKDSAFKLSNSIEHPLAEFGDRILIRETSSCTSTLSGEVTFKSRNYMTLPDLIKLLDASK